MKGMIRDVHGVGENAHVSWIENIPSLLICPSCHKTDGGLNWGWEFTDDFFYVCTKCSYSILLKDLYERDLFWVQNKEYTDHNYGFLVYGNRPVKMVD